MAAAFAVPDDLIVDILSKLPVKSLLRFNCVCKTWYSLISDPQFSNSLHRMRPCVLFSGGFREFSTIATESFLASDDRAITPLFLPWQTEGHDHIILGSCNGLVCVYHRNDDLILWNPSTRKFKKLPCPPGRYFERGLCTFVWFGYDELIDDYKLILLIFYWHLGIAELYVFRLKSNTWRRTCLDYRSCLDHRIAVDFLRGCDVSNRRGVLSNGAIHWIRPTVSIEECILALDLTTETFRILKLSRTPYVRLSDWIGNSPGGCLCLSGYAHDVGCAWMILWIMKEYGVESSWTMLSIPVPNFHCVRFFPILFSEEGKEVVAICDSSRENQTRIVKLRVEEELKNGSFEGTLWWINKGDKVILHMEESLVSL